MFVVVLTYTGLFVWSFLAATVLPMSSEILLAAVIQSQRQLVAPVLVATAGNYLGACTTYWFGRRAAQLLAKPQGLAAQLTCAAQLMRRYGQPVLLLSWVPLIGDGLVAVAGATDVPLDAFSFWVILGKGLRYLVVGWTALALAVSA